MSTKHRTPTCGYFAVNAELFLFFLNFFNLFVHCRRRFATSVPFKRSCPFCQGSKVSIRIFFSLLSISVYIFKTSKLSMSLTVISQTDSVSNGKNVSKLNFSANSVSNCKFYFTIISSTVKRLFTPLIPTFPEAIFHVVAYPKLSTNRFSTSSL